MTKKVKNFCAPKFKKFSQFFNLKNYLKKYTNIRILMADKATKKPVDDNESEGSVQSDDEFEPTDGAEEFEDYKPEGYHPVTLGEVFNSRYQVVQKLGWGYFSTVWLVIEKGTSNHFALKIQKSKKSYSEAAVDELEILKALAQNATNPEWQETINELNKTHNLTLQPLDTFNIRLFDNFVHHGMHGKHYCSVFEIMGPNLLDLIQFFEYQDKGMDIRLVKIITRQILMGLDYMHRVCKVIHTDLKPENIMVEVQGTQLEEFIADLKEYKKKPLSMKYLKKIQTRNSKNKKKQQKKKLKKQQQKAEAEAAAGTGTEGTEATTETEATATPVTENTTTTEPVDNATPIQVKAFNQDDLEEKKEEVKVNEGEKPAECQEEEEKVNPEDNTGDDWCYTLKWKDHINVRLDKNIRIKIVDFGNGCWVHKHFTDNIQTREYRSPEVLLGIPYKENTDIWSLACTVFEMLTSNFLFKPKKSEKYSKNDDHLALMMEHLGKMPKNFALKGKYSREYLNKNGQLLKIKDLKETTILDALMEEDQIPLEEAEKIEQFLLPMLQYDPDKRISAQEALKNEWLWT